MYEIFEVADIIGLEEGLAKELCIMNGFELQKIEEDGVGFITTCDFRTDRINVVVSNGIITSAEVG